MGTDLYYHVEVRIAGAWTLVRDVELYSLFRRNYPLYAILANVRNPVQYEDHDSDYEHHFRPIAMPRGMPSDASWEYATLANNEIAEYGESLTYLTVREILDYDWSQRVERLAVPYSVFLEDFVQLDLPALLDLGEPEHVRLLLHFA